jgi:hypothetical protein
MISNINKIVIRTIFACGVTLGLIACASPRVDFDGYLNSSIGKVLPDSRYDHYATHFVSPKKLLLTENQDTYIYRYWYQESACSWDVYVEKKTNLILRWHYSSQKASDDCHNIPARRSV